MLDHAVSQLPPQESGQIHEKNEGQVPTDSTVPKLSPLMSSIN